MHGITGWDYRPYALLDAPEQERELFICQAVPLPDGFRIVFADARPGEHVLCYRPLGQEKWLDMPCKGQECLVRGLAAGADYQCRVLRADGQASQTRLVRTGAVPGRVVNYLHPQDPIYAFSGRYLCSPSLLALPDGRLLASMDVYAAGQAQNLSILFESLDGGESWHYKTELYPCFWGKLFFHQGRVHMLAMACEYGDLLLGRSEDGGAVWTPPVRLFNGSNARQAGPHKAPMPVLQAHGRLYTAIDYGSWLLGGHASAILSIDEKADPMRPENWRLTTPLPFDGAWPGLPLGQLSGCLEGNALLAPDGGIVSLLRLEQKKADPACGQAVLLRMRGMDAPLAFQQVINFPLGANSKFVVLQEGGWYIAVGNEAWNSETPRARNVLSAALSRDLVHWRVVWRIVDASSADPALNAFQYPDAQIVGDDLLVLSRTAWNGSHSFHDSNFITFHRVPNFRRFLRDNAEEKVENFP